MKRRGRRLVFTLLLIAVTIGIDQCAKGVARAVLPPAQPIALLPGVVLCLTRNPGAFLSFGSSLSGGVRFWALTVGVSVGLVALFAWLLASRSLTAAPSAGMALIL
jgi:lipoprotein signal peptidase